MAEKYLERHAEIFQGTEQGKFIPNPVNGDEEVQLPEGFEKRRVFAWVRSISESSVAGVGDIRCYLSQVGPSYDRMLNLLTCPWQVYPSTAWQQKC